MLVVDQFQANKDSTRSFHGSESLRDKSFGNCFSMMQLVGGFNPFEKYESNWIISPGRGENEKYLKPPPSSQ